jgi:hypothetical protein
VLVLARMRFLIIALVLVFASTNARAESAAWLEDYIEKNPQRKIAVRTTEKPAVVGKADRSKSKKNKRMAKAQAKKKAKAKKSKAKRRRR